MSILIKNRISTLYIFLLLGFFDSNAGEFLRKQTGITAIPDGSTSVAVAIPIEVDMSKSILIFSSTDSGNQPAYYQVGGEITNSSLITFARTGTSGQVDIKWQIVEFEAGVYVQHGSSLGVAQDGTSDVAINCVDLTKSFVITSARKSGSTFGNDDGFTSDLTTSTNLQFNTNGGASGADVEEIYWQVIEYQAAIVKKVTASLTGTSTTSDLTAQTGSAVTDMAKTFVVSGHRHDSNLNPDDLPRTELTSTNLVTYTRVGSDGTLTFITYVVEFTDASTVEHNSLSFADTELSKTIGITASSSSVVIGPGNFGRQGSSSFSTNDIVGHGWFTYEIDGQDIDIDRAIGAGSADIPFQIVTFEDTGLQQSTFYSIATGAWEDNTSWSFSSNGSSGAVPTGVFPNKRNDVVIRNGHEITISAIDDNAGCATSPDDLGSGPFVDSGVDMFHQTGDIIIDAGGILTVETQHIFEGYTYVNGTLNSNQDLVNRGNLEVTSSGTLITDDDLIISGISLTILDNTTLGTDDLYIDGTEALLCGSGTLSVGNSGPDPIIQYLNGATSTQVCGSITVSCSSNCGGFTAPSPTGSFSLGYTGPGGVDATNGTSALALWLDASSISQTTATDITTWTDLSGYGNDATPPANAPEFNTNQINGLPAVEFDAANTEYLTVANDNSLNPTTVSLFCVGNITSSSDNSGGLIAKFDDFATPYDGYALVKNGANLESSSIINEAANSLGSANTITSGAYVVFEAVYDQSQMELYHNEDAGSSLVLTDAITANSNALYLGNLPGLSNSLDGDIAEAIVIGRGVNDAERIIIGNYLSAKYNIAMVGNDVYEQDDNGDFDIEVAGIGQASDGSFNKDAQGDGLVRINLPTDLDNNEYMMWGHDGTGLSAANSTDIYAEIESRLERVWRVSENNESGTAVDVGTVRLTFDLQFLPASTVGSDMRLLISRGAAGPSDFATFGLAPRAGSYNIDNQLITFSNVSFVDGDYFTLGTTNDTASPLPIELISFSATPKNDLVELNWVTASELNNDFFTIEKSSDGEYWDVVTQIEGKGTTQNQHEYSTIDIRPLSGLSYYRLKQTDYDGTFTYSEIVSIVVNSNQTISIYPNPSNGSFRIKTIFELNPADILIYDLAGRRIQSTITQQEYTSEVRLNETPTGFYILEINDGLKTYKQKILLKR